MIFFVELHLLNRKIKKINDANDGAKYSQKYKRKSKQIPYENESTHIHFANIFPTLSNSRHSHEWIGILKINNNLLLLRNINRRKRKRRKTSKCCNSLWKLSFINRFSFWIVYLFDCHNSVFICIIMLEIDKHTSLTRSKHSSKIIYNSLLFGFRWTMWLETHQNADLWQSETKNVITQIWRAMNRNKS